MFTEVAIDITELSPEHMILLEPSFDHVRDRRQCLHRWTLLGGCIYALEAPAEDTGWLFDIYNGHV